MSDNDDEIDFEDDPLARWEAALLPNWTWEAYEVEERNVNVVVETTDEGEPVTEETDIYFGRVKSPNTYGSWEYGSFSAHDLKQAGAFRVDEDTGEWP